MKLFEGQVKRMVEMAGISKKDSRKALLRLDEATWQQYYMTLPKRIDNILGRLNLMLKLPSFATMANKELIAKKINVTIEALQQAKELLSAPVNPKEQIYKVGEVLSGSKVTAASIKQICNLVAGTQNADEFLEQAETPEQKQLAKLLFTDSAAVWMQAFESTLKEMSQDPEVWDSSKKKQAPIVESR